MPRLYGPLAAWWHVMSDPAEYAEEAGIYREAIEATAPGKVRTLLELGCGGGNNASYLKALCQLTLSDRSPEMLEQSRRLNPERERVLGDMRTLRLGRTVDAVFVHDAIMYLTTEQDLAALFETAYLHCSPGGLALFVPDDTKESWKPESSSGGHDRGDRSLRYLQWAYDPDPGDGSFDPEAGRELFLGVRE